MAAAIDLERLLDALELSCACCLQYFTEPVRLPGCGHSFCRGCIALHCSGRQRAACPLCREGFELKNLRPNRELVALVNLIPQEVKEKELETRGERKPSGAVACNDRSSPGEKEEETWDISKQPEVTAETIHLLRKDLREAKDYASLIKSQITTYFCCMKEYVERQKKNTLMIIEQEQKAAQQKIEETIRQLSVEVNKPTDLKAQTSSLPERHKYKGSPSKTKITLDEKLNAVKSAVEDLKRKLEFLLLEKYARQFPPVQLADFHQETSVCSLSPEAAAENPEPTISSQFSQCKYASQRDSSVTIFQ
ncbi:hypothetical protein Q9966_006157 [Columba livia]|nr:hypothetical protein Q9966_006157 [Columba livia]